MNIEKMKIIDESFNSIQTFLQAINSRPNNEVMLLEKSSISGSESFTGTKNYDEAVSLFQKGWGEKVNDIKKGLAKNKKTYHNYLSLPKNLPTNAPIGYIPNVPNALINLPNSMIYVEKKTQKRKTLIITYAITGNCTKTIDFFLNAGVALVTAINIIEAQGIQTKLNIAPLAIGKKEIIFPRILLKNFGEKFDLQKICFPMIHPSMLRRIYFKYIETCPQLTDYDYSFAYGHAPRSMAEWEAAKIKISQTKDEFLISTNDIDNVNCEVDKILELFNISTKVMKGGI